MLTMLSTKQQRAEQQEQQLKTTEGTPPPALFHNLRPDKPREPCSDGLIGERERTSELWRGRSPFAKIWNLVRYIIVKAEMYRKLLVYERFSLHIMVHRTTS